MDKTNRHHNFKIKHINRQDLSQHFQAMRRLHQHQQLNHQLIDHQVISKKLNY